MNEIYEEINAQEFEAEEERKLQMRRIIVASVIIFFAVFYFLWANYINFGYLEVSAQVPFSVNITDEKEHYCEVSPCKIKLKRGEKFVIVRKTGFKSYAVQEEVILWHTKPINAVLKLEPYIRKVDEIPEGRVVSDEVKYEFIYDSSHNNYAVTKEGDEYLLAVSYFGGRINSPFLIGSNYAVLVIENIENGKVFYIDAITKERESLFRPFNTVAKAKISPNGKIFVIESDKKQIFLADQDGFTKIEGIQDIKNVYWTLKNTLVVFYLKTINSDDKISYQYVFEEHNPVSKEQILLFSTEEMIGDLTPKNIKVNNYTNTVFFESGDDKYEIIL